MKLNETTFIIGQNVQLIPYKEDHVPKYHSWMQQKELREATSSDLLNLNEEYTMQRSWREDEDKCTFIIADKAVLEETKNEVESIIGDVNLFLRRDDDKIVAEVSIMIAEKSGRRQGKGFEALCLMLKYGVQYLNVDIFEAKIGFGNVPSVNLFEKIGFKLINCSEVFQEATYTVDVTSEWKTWLTKITMTVDIIS